MCTQYHIKNIKKQIWCKIGRYLYRLLFLLLIFLGKMPMLQNLFHRYFLRQQAHFFIKLDGCWVAAPNIQR